MTEFDQVRPAMTRDEKKDFCRSVAEIEEAVAVMNGPYRPTTRVLALLAQLRDFMGDAVFSQCETCDDLILESEMDSATSGDEGGWYCATCVARWNETAA